MRRTASGRGMGGLLEARPEMSTQEFAPRSVAMRKRRMARLILGQIMRWSHSAGIKLAIRAGYQTLGMGGARGGIELPPGHSPDLEERFLKYLVLVWELWLIVSGRWVPQGIGFDRDDAAGRTAPSWGISQPPPKSRPGPSEARKIGRRAPRGCLEALRKASCNAPPHVDEPRFPETRAMGGKVLRETPHCLARRATRRGFGWCVANPPTEPRAIPLRNSTDVITFSIRVIAARERASPSNFTPRRPSFDSLTWMAAAYWPAQPKRNSPRP